MNDVGFLLQCGKRMTKGGQWRWRTRCEKYNGFGVTICVCLLPQAKTLTACHAVRFTGDILKRNKILRYKNHSGRYTAQISHASSGRMRA